MTGSRTSSLAESRLAVGSPNSDLAPSPTSTKHMAPHDQAVSTASKPCSESRHTSSSTFSSPRTTAVHRLQKSQAIALDVESFKAAADNNLTMASVVSPAASLAPAGPPKSVTSKEWVIPPRPKPGRKPATDTPPTKRKAQNRAAQRAFRERRAARVGELEEQLEEQTEEHQREQQLLKDRIHSLELEAQTLKTRCQVLENMLERERFERRKWSEDSSRNSISRRGSVTLLPAHNPSLTGPLFPSAGASQYHGRSYEEQGHHMATSPASGPRSQNHSFSISQIISPPEEAVSIAPASLSCGSCGPTGSCACAEEVLAATVGCGNCSLGTKCECLEATVEMAMGSSDLKRPHRPDSPSSTGPEPEEKRQRSDTVMETDFTSYFTNKKSNTEPNPAPRSFLPPPVQSIPPRDSCGFCTEGTYCVCADAMNPIVSTTPNLTAPIPASNPTRQIQTPPPSETDVMPPPMEVTATGAIKLPSFESIRYAKAAAAKSSSSSSSSCGPGGPGTCAQCIADPKSGLFCRSLAASLEKSGQSSSGGCCGGGGPGGCCKQQPAKTSKPNGERIGLSLSCADTYKTLSSHKAFGQATDDLATWLPLLKAAPKPQPMEPGNSATAPRPAMDVEAASIMSVLKGFDVRFGSGN